MAVHGKYSSENESIFLLKDGSSYSVLYTDDNYAKLKTDRILELSA